MTTGAVTTCYSTRIVIGLQKTQLRLLLLQHLDHAREILAAMPCNAVRRVDGAGHAAQRGAGLGGDGVFLREAQVLEHEVGAEAAGVALAAMNVRDATDRPDCP